MNELCQVHGVPFTLDRSQQAGGVYYCVLCDAMAKQGALTTELDPASDLSALSLAELRAWAAWYKSEDERIWLRHKTEVEARENELKAEKQRIEKELLDLNVRGINLLRRAEWPERMFRLVSAEIVKRVIAAEDS